MTRILALLALLLALLPASSPAPAQVPPPLDRLHRADGAMVVPERFLREWDPLTIFFPADVGPADGGAENAPERLVTLDPPQPGAWTWFDSRTLQFRPAEPWVPLRRETVSVGDRSVTLVPLLPMPVETAPSDSSGGIADLDSFTLTFARPVDVDVLARLLTIELRPAPGISSVGGQLLSAQDFTVTAADRGERKDRQPYRIALRRPVPDGQVAILRLRLSDMPGLDDPVFELRLRSAVPFTLSRVRCGAGTDSISDGELLRCEPYGWASGEPASPRGLTLEFTAPPAAMDIVTARQALRFTPPVDDLAVSVRGTTLSVTGRFLAGTEYELRVDPGLKDARGRSLQTAPEPRRFAFSPLPPALDWDAPQGIVERLGPQMLPMRGHGYGRADLRIHPIDALSRDFWPFPQGVVTQDDKPPPLPGNEPTAWSDAAAIDADALKARLQALGSPPVSELVDLSIARGGVDAKFGTDAAPLFARIAGAGQPGVYLLGLRLVDGTWRTWLRVQVTDLSLTAVEEPDRVRFAVTSLSTARPVAGAEIGLDGCATSGSSPSPTE